MGTRTNPEKRAELLTEFEKSGLTQTAFAEKHGLNIGTFRGWLYKRLRSLRSPSEQRFVEVHASAAHPSAILRVGSVELEFAETPPVDYLAELLRRLC